MLKLLIAVDGSEHAKHAIAAVGRLAAATTELRVTLLNVSPSPSFYGEMTPRAFDQLETAIYHEQKRVLEEAQVLAKAAGLTVLASVRTVGVVASEIVRVAEQEDIDQIVIGTHGRGVMGNFFLGSVAQRVVHISPLPVLLVK
ncbi:universal stress protein [Roseateles oligotrophus]|uniref:Universal stress protein n=1 Tax=Roseateles oligotrophus TaxID=1769250 RepID=A0ABT2YMP6_9BURK|nr:universal stress protein [Roseateles oligotrophus]MCV2371345.1 universal stress protein [Roseateles oligotrophus]